MKTIVITGSTRGIGFGLAREFLALGCKVVISGRKQDAVDKAVAELAKNSSSDRVMGLACDTTNLSQVQALWDRSFERFGKVDIWVNNAGLSRSAEHYEDIPPQELRAVVETNILGALNGATVAMRGMRAQGSGAIYNMEGLGSDGMKLRGQYLYGLTKYALAYFTDTLAAEAKGSAVIVGAIRPGMVMTNLITSQPGWERSRAIIEAIAESVETVTKALAPRILANRKNGARLSFSSPLSMLAKLPKILSARRSIS